ncbi:hypothetical protein ACP4OV_025577 [Aristida adscensionis]
MDPPASPARRTPTRLPRRLGGGRRPPDAPAPRRRPRDAAPPYPPDAPAPRQWPRHAAPPLHPPDAPAAAAAPPARRAGGGLRLRPGGGGGLHPPDAPPLHPARRAAPPRPTAARRTPRRPPLHGRALTSAAASGNRRAGDDNSNIWKHAQRELRQKVSEERELDLRAAKESLDHDHYGLTKVKQRIIEYLAVRKLKPDARGPVLCFVGPPTIGKTSLASSIAKPLINMKFIRISLGGVKDEADIRGHRRTYKYIGSMPGRLIDGLQAGSQ